MKINFAGQEFILHSSGGLYWPAKHMLIVADAHLEKGSFFARRGFHLPPYDSHMTLTRLLEVCESLSIQQVMILGDFFHDNFAHHRLSPESLALFEQLKKFPVIWVKGNHDVGYKPHGIDVFDEYEAENIMFRHEATEDTSCEISGHFHPKSEFVYKGKLFRERCFVEDGCKLMLPAFGAYTGGLSINNKAIRKHFGDTLRQYIVINDRIIYVPDVG